MILTFFLAGFYYKNNPYQFEISFLGGLLGFSKTVFSKKEQMPLYFYPKYASLLNEDEKESKYYLHFLWFKF